MMKRELARYIMEGGNASRQAPKGKSTELLLGRDREGTFCHGFDATRTHCWFKV